MKFCKTLKLVQIIVLTFLMGTSLAFNVSEVFADECSEVLALINKERTANFLEPLRVDPDLEDAAKVRGEELTRVLSHTRPDGTKYSTVSPKAEGETLAVGYKTPKEVVAAWMNSPGHRRNILDPSFTTVGTSFTKTNSDHKYHWVQLFGRDKVTIYIERVSGVKAKSNKNQVTLTWKKQLPSKASGFEVFGINSKKGTTTLLTRMTKPTDSSFLINGLQKSTTYKFQIRSYRVVNNVMYYSSYVTVTARTK